MEDSHGLGMREFLTQEREWAYQSIAARLLEARVYLYMGRNSEALAAATDVINNSPYRMVSGDGYANYWGKEGDLESVLELLVSVQGDIDSDGGLVVLKQKTGNVWAVPLGYCLSEAVAVPANLF